MQNAFHTLYKAMSNKNKNFQRPRDKGDTQGLKQDRQTRKESKRKLHHLDKIKRGGRKNMLRDNYRPQKKNQRKDDTLKRRNTQAKSSVSTTPQQSGLVHPTPLPVEQSVVVACYQPC